MNTKYTIIDLAQVQELACGHLIEEQGKTYYPQPIPSIVNLRLLGETAMAPYIVVGHHTDETYCVYPLASTRTAHESSGSPLTNEPDGPWKNAVKNALPQAAAFILGTKEHTLVTAAELASVLNHCPPYGVGLLQKNYDPAPRLDVLNFNALCPYTVELPGGGHILIRQETAFKTPIYSLTRQ